MRSVSTAEEYQENTLFSIVSHAKATVPFYMNLYENASEVIEEQHFWELPVINKDKYVSGGMSGLSAAYMGEYIRKELLYVRTSGTSGTFSEVYWHAKEMQRSLLSLWLLRKKYYGITGKNKMCYFYQAEEGAALCVDRGNSLAIARDSLHNTALDTVYQNILSYNPEWMILQPGIALILCECAEQYGKPSALRYIEFTGEYLEPSLRKKVERVFQCKTANQYGTKEVNSIAYECPCGNMHVMSDNVYVEMIADEGDSEIEYVCVTSLQNYAMPLIRFQLEDRGILHRNVECDCGCKGDVLELLSGRANDMVRMKDGSTRHPFMLMDIFQIINYQTEGAILQYQIEQQEINQFVVRFILEEEELLDEITERIQEEFTSRLGYPVQIEFICCQTVLPMSNAGKPAVFRSRLGGEV